jgi:hypothetical protein
MLHEERPRAVHGLQVSLLHRLDRDNAHRGPTYRFANRFRIAPIMLVGLDVGLDLRRVHPLDRMPELVTRSPPVLRTPARFHPDHTGWQTRYRVYQRITFDASAEHRAPSCIHPV